MSATLKRTPLADEHIASGARMVDFGGWDMPLAYGSQLEEHHAVRQDAGMFDVSHMLNVDVAGPDAYAFLQRLVANDVAKLIVPGKALYSCMLNPQGGVIDDLIIYFFAADEWRVVVNAGTADKDVAWMQRVKQAGNFDVAITPRRDLAMVAVQGPNARAKVWASRPAWQAASEALTPLLPPAWATTRSSPAPATPAKTALKSSCLRPTSCNCGATLLPRACARRAWARATRCAWKPA